MSNRVKQAINCLYRVVLLLVVFFTGNHIAELVRTQQDTLNQHHAMTKQYRALLLETRELLYKHNQTDENQDKLLKENNRLLKELTKDSFRPQR